MKKLLIVLLLLVATNVYSQFDLKGSVGGGIKIDKNLDYSLFQSNMELTTQYQVDKFLFSAVFLAVSDSVISEPFTGFELGYNVWQLDKNKSLFLSAHALMGTVGKKLFGGTLTYQVADLSLGLMVSQEYKNKQTWISANVGYSLLNF